MSLVLDVRLDRRRREPLFLQLARAVAEAIAQGRLAKGEALPSTRALATTLRVHRNTVVAAYAELVSEGWAVARQGDATRVAHDVPRSARIRPRSASPRATERPGYALAHVPSLAEQVPRVRYALLGGVPELRTLDVTSLARAYRRALGARRRDTLGYVGPEGDARLRAALGRWLARERGLAIGEDDVMITRGSQMALALAAKVLIAPGDVVAVEAPGYPFAWAAFRDRGATVVPVPVDAEGLDVAALEALARRTRLRAIYVTPHHQYPTTVTLSPSRRLALLALARRERIAVVEDDYDHEFHYDGRPVLPLASRDPDGSVIYVGTFAKILAPALRVGFVVAPRAVLSALASARAALDRQGDPVLERAVAELIDDGFVDRHVRKARRVYRARRDALASALGRALPGVIDFDVPRGGLSLWARVAPDLGIDAELWRERALARDVLVLSGARFALGPPPNALRIGYGAVSASELVSAVGLLAAALPRPRAGSSVRRAKKSTKTRCATTTSAPGA